MNSETQTNTRHDREWGPFVLRLGLLAGILYLGWSVACIKPPDLTGFQCGTSNACPPQQVCVNGFCQNKDAATDGATPDASPDGTTPDASPDRTTPPDTNPPVDQKPSENPADTTITPDKPGERTAPETNPGDTTPPEKPGPEESPTVDNTAPPERRPADEPPPPEQRPEPPLDTGPVQCTKTTTGSDGQCSNPGECCIGDCSKTKNGVFPLSKDEFHCLCRRDEDCQVGYKCKPHPLETGKFACFK